MIVIDASLAAAVMINPADGEALSHRIEAGAGALAAPEVLDLELVQVMRRYVRLGGSPQRVAQGFQTLEDLRILRFSHAPLRERVWALRDNLTAYDAAYFALAEALDVPLWTRDAKFADVPGSNAAVELI